jgi:hypothetical protein
MVVGMQGRSKWLSWKERVRRGDLLTFLGVGKEGIRKIMVVIQVLMYLFVSHVMMYEIHVEVRRYGLGQVKVFVLEDLIPPDSQENYKSLIVYVD